MEDELARSHSGPEPTAVILMVNGEGLLNWYRNTEDKKNLLMTKLTGCMIGWILEENYTVQSVLIILNAISHLNKPFKHLTSLTNWFLTHISPANCLPAVFKTVTQRSQFPASVVPPSSTSGPTDQIQPVSVFVSEVSLEHRHAHWFACFRSYLYTAVANQTCSRGCITSKAQNIYSLALY